MQQFTSASSARLSKSASFLCLLVGAVSLVLSSPKWTVPLCAWVAPAALLLFFRYTSFKRKYLWLLLAIAAAQTISFYEVVPIPGAGLFVFVLMNSALATLPYWIDKAIAKRSGLFVATLIFPIAFTAVEFISSFGPWGAWGSVANTQFRFSYIAQLASVTGIWGIAFILYWLASYTAWLSRIFIEKQTPDKAVWVYPMVLFVIVAGGAIRYHSDTGRSDKVRVAGVTVSAIPFLEAMYKDVNGKEIRIPLTASPVSPEVQAANSAFAHFIAQPGDAIFTTAPQVLNQITDSLFLLSCKAVARGAQLIVWSEGSAIVLKPNEPLLIVRAQRFAKENKVNLLMAMAVIHSGEITPGKKFLENKTLYIGADGTVKNTFYKNKPVPGVEASVAGDGVVPSIETKYGKIATSICYDADFPSLMQQLGHHQTGLLLLPSGDWRAISPYHSEAAAFRAIENGCSLFRQANGGLSIATDDRGRIIAQKDFFDNGEKLWLANVPVHHFNTLYNKLGDALGYVCLVITIGFIFYLFAQWIISKVQKQKPFVQTSVLLPAN